ncbi:Short-chain dehydrogenase/reductase SDR [Penicillium roqueforti FM164]|uniref:Short-chain dehydrogenase/reductase SDR n=2 Tax=Penicillium roqueforti TaxID=5082 RepID=W6QM60_PENRF|nr:Short-chain dehydrogenase/reductase SDR [Penicillium roqueforti FM164]
MPASFDLHGKVALITGAGRGLGASIAKELASHGALCRGQLCSRRWASTGRYRSHSGFARQPTRYRHPSRCDQAVGGDAVV